MTPLLDTIVVPGAELGCVVDGDGPPLLVLHGGPGLGMGYLRRDLTRALPGFALHYYDQRGSGHSTGASDASRATIETFVEDADLVRKAFGLERADLVGHSFGGLLALHYALAHPEGVRSLTLLDPDPATFDEWDAYRGVVESRQTAADKADLEAITQNLGWEKDPARFSELLRVYFRAYVADRAVAQRLDLELDERVIANHEKTSPRLRRTLGRWDLREKLPSIACPVLVVHGAASVFSRASAETIAAGIPGARLVVLDGAGHFPQLEAPERLAAAVRELLGALK